MLFSSGAKDCQYLRDPLQPAIKKKRGCYSHLVGRLGVEEGSAGVLEIAIRFP